MMQQFQATTTSGNSVRFDGGVITVAGASGGELATISVPSIALVMRSGSELVLQLRDGEPARLTFSSILDAERLEYLLTSRGAPGGAFPRQSSERATPWLKTASGKALLASLIVAVVLLAITIVLCISLAAMFDDETSGNEAGREFLPPFAALSLVPARQ